MPEMDVTRPLIAIDGYNLALEQGTGVATYARGLSQRLGAMGAEVGVLWGQRGAAGRDELLREVALFEVRAKPPGKIKRFMDDVVQGTRLRFGVDARPIPVTDRVIKRAIEARVPHADRMWNVPDLFRAAVVSFGIDNRVGRVRIAETPRLMHWTYPLPLRVEGARNIFTIHDLVPLRLPYATLDNKKRFLGTVRGIAATADHIVTVSEASKRDIMSLLDVPEERITVTYQSIDIPDRLRSKPEAMVRAEIEGSFGLSWQGYWLYYGAIEPKKNIGRLIEAYLASGSTLPLVVVGKQAWQIRQELGLLYEDDQRIMTDPGPIEGIQSFRRKLRDRVILLDYAPFRLLVSLVRGARALLFPSLYEGFGLPPLEAMSLGTPVLTSNTSSLPEVVGEAAMMVDPYDTRALAEGIMALDADADLRARLAAAGPGQAQKFSAEAYDQRLTSLYAKLGVTLPAGG